MKHILLIGGHEETVLIATSMQAKWSLFQKEDMISDLQKSVCHHVFIQNYEDLPETIELARQLHKIDPIDVVLSFTEYGLEAAGEIKESLSIEGSPKFPIEVSRDKLKMRALLSSWESGTINYQACYRLRILNHFLIDSGIKLSSSLAKALVVREYPQRQLKRNCKQLGSKLVPLGLLVLILPKNF